MPDTQQPSEPDQTVEVAIIGGGPAGLAAALSCARSRRSVVVVDAGDPRNAPAAGVHAFLTRDGTPPSELLAIGRAEVASYGGRIIDGEVVGARRVDDRLHLELAEGQVLAADRVVVTTGIADRLPPVPGLAEHWGSDVVHCPFCHGWEVRDRRIGVLATGPFSLHQATLFGHLASELVLLRHTATLDEDALAALVTDGVRVIDGEVVAVHGEDHLTGVELADGSIEPLGALVVMPRFEIAGRLLADLGLRAVEHPSGLGLHVPAAADGQTDVPGVWVAGNVTDPSAQVMAAAAQGNMAGARVHVDLLQARRDGAVAA